MFNGSAEHLHGEFRHCARFIAGQIVLAEFGDGQRDGFIQGFRIHLNGVAHAGRIGVADKLWQNGTVLSPSQSQVAPVILYNDSLFWEVK